ncbi:D-amino-acid transaminase [Brucella intermedia]|uniref:D-amino-acid transaminase n=1 Tax=Brucella intermedia TaxID=94625 RepID=UPI00244E763B|nr:D-amino-acid transaminase [Brucella intermedia]WGJ08560.1 D-amino-acid transaminase [Brucella intermedia]
MLKKRTVYLNGNFVPQDEANISVFDRGFLFADAVYEVVSVIDGKILDFDGHAARLDRSLSELRIRQPLHRQTLLDILRQLIIENQLDQGLVYLQISRGNPGDRDFAFPDEAVQPTVVMFTQAVSNLIDGPKSKTGVKVISVPDLRWARRDIKTVQLLYPSMAKMLAKQAGVDDAWFVQDGFVTEGTANNAYIVKDNKVITRALSNDILHGITRTALLRYVADTTLEIVERRFTIKEVMEADEAFITGASTFVTPVIAIDGESIGTGKPGQITRDLRALYISEARKTAI